MSKNITRIFLIASVLLLVIPAITNAKKIIVTENYFKNVLANQVMSVLSAEKTKCYFGYCFLDLPDKKANEVLSNGFGIEDKPIFKINRLQSLSLTSVYKLWNESFLGVNLTGTGIKVAIIDTGIDVGHADINYTFSDKNNWKYCYNSIDGINATVYGNLSICNDTDGHGTFVAGIIAGRYQGNITKCFEGYECGVAPNVTLITIKAFEGEYAYLSDIMDGINYAVENGADIISMSFGAETNISCYDPEISILTNTIDKITEEGVITVASAGNGLYTNNTLYVEGTVFPPACSKNIIAVGSTDKSGKISYFSSRGPTSDGRVKPDLVAPGEDIHSTTISDYGYGSGTSFSAPFVSGIAALLKEYLNNMNISMSTQDIKAILLASANSYGERNNTYGSGMVNATRALELINQSKYFDSSIPFDHALSYKVNLIEKPAKIVIYRNSNSSESFVLYAKLIAGNEVIYSNAYGKNDNVNEIFYNGSLNEGWLYLKLNNSYDKPFTIASNIEIEKSPYEFIYVEKPDKEKYLATDKIDILAYIGDIDGISYNKSINMTIYYPNGTTKTVLLNYTGNGCNYTIDPEIQGNYTFEFSASYSGVTISPVNVTVEVKSFSFNITQPKDNSVYLVGDVVKSSVTVSNATGNYLNTSSIIVNGTLINENSINVKNITFYLNSSENNSATFVANFTANVTAGNYTLKTFLYVDDNLVDENSVGIKITDNFILNITTNVTNNSVYYPGTIASFLFSVYHPNGTELNLSNLNTSVYFVNESSDVFNYRINETNGTIELNGTKAGDYYLFFNVSDSKGNYQNYTLLVHLSYKARNVSISLSRLNYTLDSFIKISINAFENETNMSVYKAKVEALLIYGSKKVSNITETDSLGNANIDIKVPEDITNGTYNVTINITDSFGNIIVENKTVDILTLFPIIIAPKSINTTDNITFNITLLDYKLDSYSGSITVVLSGTYLDGRVDFNTTLVSGSDVQVSFAPFSNEPMTYTVDVIASDNPITPTYKGINTTRIYSGVVIRPTSDRNIIGCKPNLMTNATKDYCVFDSKGQHDLVINPNEKLVFSALLYYGSTVDSDNFPTNITYYLNVSNSSSGELVLNLTGNLSTNNVTIEIPPLNKTGDYNVKVKIYEYNPGEVLEDEFNVSVEKLNVTILTPSSLDVYDIDDSIKFYGVVEKDGSRVSSANISISSNTTELSYTCLNNNKTNSTGEFDCSVKFNKLGNFSVNVSAIDEYGIEGYDVQDVSIKDLDIEIAFSPTDPVNGSEITVTAKVKILPDDKWIDGGNVTFEFYGSCGDDGKVVTYEQSKSTGYIFTQKVTPEKPEKCYVDITAVTKDGKLRETKKASIDVSEAQQEQGVSGGGITADLDIVEYTQKLYMKPGETNYTLIEVLAYNTKITQNVSLYVLSIPSTWYTVKPSSMLIEPDKTGVFNVTFSIPKDATPGEYTGLFKVNSSYAADSKAFKIVIVGEEENETNITATAEIFYNTYEEKLKVWNSTILSLKNESYNTTEIEEIYNEISKLLSELKKSIETGNTTEIESIMTRIKQKEIEIATAFQKVEPIKEIGKKGSSKMPTILVIIGVFFVAILVYLFWPFEGKPRYDHKKGKFTWKPPKEKSEIDKLWEKIKEKIQKLAS